MYNHHLAVSVFISNMPQRTTKGCQLNKVLDKQWVVHNFFFHTNKKPASADDQRSAQQKTRKKVGGKQPHVQKKNC